MFFNKKKDIFTYQVPNFQMHKQKLIDLIKKIPKNKFDEISHTDWNLSTVTKKEWYEYFFKNILSNWAYDLSLIINLAVEIEKCWFQWYEKNDVHHWHTHNRCHFTNIFYLNLPNKSIKTIVKKFDEEQKINIDEGKILSFPAYWEHRSPKNIFKEPKIIISFNTSFHSNSK